MEWRLTLILGFHVSSESTAGFHFLCLRLVHGGLPSPPAGPATSRPRLEAPRPSDPRDAHARTALRRRTLRDAPVARGGGGPRGGILWWRGFRGCWRRLSRSALSLSLSLSLSLTPSPSPSLPLSPLQTLRYHRRLTALAVARGCPTADACGGLTDARWSGHVTPPPPSLTDAPLVRAGVRQDSDGRR